MTCLMFLSSVHFTRKNLTDLFDVFVFTQFHEKNLIGGALLVVKSNQKIDCVGKTKVCKNLVNLAFHKTFCLPLRCVHTRLDEDEKEKHREALYSSPRSSTAIFHTRVGKSASKG